MPLDLPTRALAIEAAREGMSLEGIAHLCGVSRRTFQEWRNADPTLQRDVMQAFAEYERRTVRLMHASLADGSDSGDGTGAKANPAVAAQCGTILERRFPWRFGKDPRVRIGHQSMGEGYREDLDDASANKTQDGAGEVIGRLVDRMLNEDADEAG